MEETSGSFCGPSSVFYYTASQQLSNIIYIFACIFNVVTSLSSVLGNIVILIALRKCQTLHLPSKALFFSLALTDLIVGLVVLPLFITYHLTIILEMPMYYCAVAVSYERAAAFIATASLFTIVVIAIDRFLAFRLHLRYRVIVTLQRIVSTLVLGWILSGVWAASWFWSARMNRLLGAVGLFSSFLIVLLCYVGIHYGLHRRIAPIRPQPIASEPDNFHRRRYRKTVVNMMWICGLFLICYVPFLSSMLALLVTGFTKYTRCAMQFSAIVIYVNSSLNPVLYCWRIKELKEKVRAISNFFSSR